ncbi:cytochrome P450 [Microdochium trichocladiopsis]|uniref:Cytochrome P450 n=1 Tax=Microdochium trichocladiopsis TaxID=1682393 RepID=A0A9P8YC89_9PEZI|nr:cytochrome P450 [Microdochium trichocladiopsis]KAH7035828.1 cytochrome P450 [Microdochium trichocladiopsis]
MDIFDLLGSSPYFVKQALSTGASVSLIATALILSCAAVSSTYNVLAHPLRPKLFAASRIPYSLMVLSGQSHKRILALHLKYGRIVRIAPDELSFLDEAAWEDIMGHRKRGEGENGKDPEFFKTISHSVIASGREDHSRMRRILSHGFSTRSMLDQQPLITQYVDLLLLRLQQNCQDGTATVDMTAWYNWTTFDIIGDLAFGEPFGCLETTSYHPWVQLIFERIRGASRNVMMRKHRWLSPLLQRLFITAEAKERFMGHLKITKEKVAQRLEYKGQRHDFMESMIRKDGNSVLSMPEIVDNASILIIAGSETTATALSAATYFLGSSPDALHRITEEIRSSFSSEDEINLLSVQRLEFMQAVINETLRLYPPVPTSIPRIIQPGGDSICGRYVPEGTTVGIWQWALYHNPNTFTDPETFQPDRWLQDSSMPDEARKTFQPFHVGPRNCIGKNLAYAEMRLILARILWSFDLRLADDCVHWVDRSETYSLWKKPALPVHLTPRKMTSPSGRS